ncbi:hypothetical protein AQ837_26215 [Burkholderia pseudomallei]|nr:hypothetical protein AQ819_31000 [Burkholderia pseudomallei]OMY16361.1 hypothetical protein AQ838_30965 [Burkholderia pseudomallei]OMY17333.1 hypothetical protein AQ837_26215 [Burkholderia pseudomallei]OMY22338.1 hypothetical protein AQ839_15210 [Burkholderia pseudomallei]OMY31675.1 hypothetical protein AQ840_27780 [Burkholderia pseudomallei]
MFFKKRGWEFPLGRRGARPYRGPGGRRGSGGPARGERGAARGFARAFAPAFATAFARVWERAFDRAKPAGRPHRRDSGDAAIHRPRGGRPAATAFGSNDGRAQPASAAQSTP